MESSHAYYSRPHTVVSAFILAALLGTTWFFTAIVARSSDATFLPLAVRYFGGALMLFVIPLLTSPRFPQISLRLLHAAITVAGLAYFLSPALLMGALRVLPSGTVALVYATLPVWLGVVAYGEGRHNFNGIAVSIVGVAAVLLGAYGQASMRGPVVNASLMLFGSMVAMLLGVWVSKRLFWLHSALDLNFWSMLFAGFCHLVFAFMFGERGVVPAFTSPYWLYLGFLSLAITGLGSYFYRLGSMQPVTATVLTVGMPLTALVLGLVAWQETPANTVLISGGVALLAILGWECYHAAPNRWLCLLLNNDKRHGDRLLCLLDGFLRPRAEGMGQSNKVQVVNLGIGGVGFRSEVAYHIGDAIVLTLPLGFYGSTVTIEGRVAHVHDLGGRAFRWVGGIEFTNLNEHRRQSLVEFLARLSKAEEDGGDGHIAAAG